MIRRTQRPQPEHVPEAPGGEPQHEPDPQSDGGAWDSELPGVSVERDDAGGTLVRHLQDPFLATWKESDGIPGLFSIADSYLEAVADVVQLPQAWRNELKSDNPPAKRVVQLRWLHDPGASAATRPWTSFVSERRPPRDLTEYPLQPGPAVDRIAVLLASFKAAKSKATDPPLNGGQGLRIVVHLGPTDRYGNAQARITGVDSTLPEWSGESADVPDWLKTFPDKIAVRISNVPQAVLPAGPTLTGITQFLGALFHLVFGVPVVKVRGFGIELPRKWSSEARTLVFRTLSAPDPALPSRDLSFALAIRATFAARVVGKRKERLADFEPLTPQALVAFATLTTNLFEQDPASKVGRGMVAEVRPNRSSKVLGKYASPVTFAGLEAGTSRDVKLKDPSGDFVVTNSRFVDAAGSPESAPKEVDDAVVPVRTNDFAAISAFYNVKRMFDAMKHAGMWPATYLVNFELPVNVRYRAAVLPGSPDAVTINAQVRWLIRPAMPGDKGTVEMCFALGDLRSSIFRSPLGIAADPRWCWHEFSHVVLLGRSGRLELGFAHSFGDALAAIACDPQSALADGRGLRGRTYPWVEIADRSHMRTVSEGWGWAGPMDRRERITDPLPGSSDRRGYWTEQILSSSLFRLYRAIGGDTEVDDGAGGRRPDVDRRKAAANHALYLIFRAVDLMASASAATPSRTAQVFVDALAKADIATPLAATASPYGAGLCHKVVDYAFRQQGLPPRSTAGSVEVRIADQREALSWQEAPYAPQNFVDDLWHADPAAVWCTRTKAQQPALVPRANQKGYLRVRAHNHGAMRAEDVRVTVWRKRLVGAALTFPDATWTSLGTRTHDIKKANASGPGMHVFGPFTWPASAGDYAVFVSATCDADRSNVDPAGGLPCASIPNDVSFLVAFDDNLALRLFTVT